MTHGSIMVCLRFTRVSNQGQTLGLQTVSNSLFVWYNLYVQNQIQQDRTKKDLSS